MTYTTLKYHYLPLVITHLHFFVDTRNIIRIHSFCQKKWHGHSDLSCVHIWYRSSPNATFQSCDFECDTSCAAQFIYSKNNLRQISFSSSILQKVQKSSHLSFFLRLQQFSLVLVSEQTLFVHVFCRVVYFDVHSLSILLFEKSNLIVIQLTCQ